jgi:hypothetical protein
MLDYFSLGVHYMFQSATCSHMFSDLSQWLFWGPKKGMSPSVRSPPVSSEAEWPPFARTTPGIWPSMGSWGQLGPFGNEKQQVMGAVHGIPSKVWTSATFGKALAKCSSITSTLLIALCGYTNVYSITGTGLSSPRNYSNCCSLLSFLVSVPHSPMTDLCNYAIRTRRTAIGQGWVVHGSGDCDAPLEQLTQIPWFR